MKNFKNITMAVVAAATLTTANAQNKTWENVKDVASRQMWTATAAGTAGLVLVLNNTVVKSMAKKAKTRSPKKVNFLKSVQTGLNWAAILALLGAGYVGSSIEANHSFANPDNQLADYAAAPEHVIKALSLDANATVEDAREELITRYQTVNNAKLLAAAKAGVLGADFDGNQPGDYLAAGSDEGQRGHADADPAKVALSQAFDAYEAARGANVDSAVNPHFFGQNSFMRFVRNNAPLFDGQADIPAAPQAVE